MLQSQELDQYKTFQIKGGVGFEKLMDHQLFSLLNELIQQFTGRITGL